MGTSEALGVMVDLFVDDVTEALERAAVDTRTRPREPVPYRELVVREAFNLCAGFVDIDDRHSDRELWALIDTFGPLLPDEPLAGSTPATLRDTEMVSGAGQWLTKPSTLFDILVTSDARHETTDATTYYRRAMDIAHLIASMDELTTMIQLDAIGHYRSMLLGHLREWGPATATPATLIPDTANTDGAPAAPTGEPPRQLEDLMAELDALVGLDGVKTEVRLVGDLLRVGQLRKQHGLPSIDTSLHLVFVGNPGTGKTTVARLLAQIYRSLGALEKGHLVETDRSGLVAGYVGQTAPLVVKRFDEADGGMLFIDEAYTLARGGDGDFGREAIDTIVKQMEDRRDRVAVVVAGYPEEMAAFIDANPGLHSRFPKTIEFPDYTSDELLTIFSGICDKNRYEMTDDARSTVAHLFETMPRVKGFGNGRTARNLFEACVARHASRVVKLDAPTETDLMTLEPSDIDGVTVPSNVPATVPSPAPDDTEPPA